MPHNVLANRRAINSVIAAYTQPVLTTTKRSKSHNNRRFRVSHAIVRSTTHLRGATSKSDLPGFEIPFVNSKSQLAERRTRAFEMLNTGFRPADIALDLGVARQTAYEWKAVFDTHGMAGAKAKPHPGPGKNITADQLEEFKTMILQGALLAHKTAPCGLFALIHGFPSNAWTCARAAALIETTFGLVYTADHVGVLEPVWNRASRRSRQPTCHQKRHRCVHPTRTDLHQTLKITQ